MCLLVLRRVTTLWGAVLSSLSVETYFAFGPWGLHYESRGAVWLLGALLQGRMSQYILLRHTDGDA